MIVKVELDPKLVWRLTDEAEKSGMSLPAYLADLVVLKAPTAPVPRSQRQQDIVRLHAEGLSDVEIAERLECVRAYVVQIRRRHGLKPNRRRHDHVLG